MLPVKEIRCIYLMENFAYISNTPELPIWNKRENTLPLTTKITIWQQIIILSTTV